MNKTNIPIYLVSLRSDTRRREDLKKRFPTNYDEFVQIEAVNGRDLSAKDYFEKTIEFGARNRRPMLPSELGCTMSHMKVLETFVNSDFDRALILEDDVLGTDSDIEAILTISRRLPEDCVLICGGQDGLRTQQYQYGEKTDIPGVYVVCNFAYRYVFRTCCYVVTKRSAQAIIDYQNAMLSLADKWSEFFKGTSIKIYYSNILAHPQELEQSHIEQDRAAFQKTGLRHEVLTLRIFENAFLSLRRNCQIWSCKLRGCKKIHRRCS